MGSGGGEEGRDSGKMDRVEQVVRELVMKDGEDLNREEEDNEVVTGEDADRGDHAGEHSRQRSGQR